MGKFAGAQRWRTEAFFTQSEKRHPPAAHFKAQRMEQRGL
jgi:hypothetical protein